MSPLRQVSLCLQCEAAADVGPDVSDEEDERRMSAERCNVRRWS